MKNLYQLILDIVNFISNIKAKYFEIETSAYDEKIKDNRDYAGAITFSYKDLPDTFIMNDKRVLNQDREGYKYSCTAQSTDGATNEELWIKADKQTYYNGDDLFNEAVKRKLADKKYGAYIIDIIKLSKELGKIDLYYQVNNNLEIMNALYATNPVVTGSNKIDWRDTLDGFVKKIGQSYGHAFIIVGWDKNIKIGEYTGGFICENSYGPDFQLKGRFWIPFNLSNEILFNTKKAIVVQPKWSKDLENNK